MTHVLETVERGLTHPRLPSWAPALVAVMAVGIGALVWLLGEARRLGTTGVALKDRSAAVPGPLGPGTGGAT